MLRKYAIRLLEIVFAFLIRLILSVFAKIRIRGMSHLRQHDSFILASNHLSYIDPPMLCAFTLPLFKRCLMPAATRGLFVFPLNLIFRVVKAIPINREQSHLNLNSLKQMIRVLKKQERNLLIFPQGGIPDKQNAHQVRDGIGLLAMKSRAPVIPAFVRGTPRVFDKDRNWFKRPRVEIRFGRPITFEDLKGRGNDDSRKRHQDASRYIMSAIMELGTGEGGINKSL